MISSVTCPFSLFLQFAFFAHISLLAYLSVATQGKYRLRNGTHAATWHDARNYCESLHANLVSIQSARKEYEVIVNLFGVHREGINFWIGGSDERTEVGMVACAV